MTLANVLHAWSASKSGRTHLDANVMPSPCSVLVICVWALLLCHNAWHVVSLKGGKEVDNAVIRTVGGEIAADVWIPRFVFNHKKICAGVTLTAEADLTSATCLNDDEPLEAFVVVESHGQNEPPVQVAHIDRCVKFDKDEQQVHDLMVCFHHCQWNFSDYVFVPRINLESDRVPNEFDQTCSVMGFGHMTPEGDKCNVLHTLEIKVGTSQDCGSQDNTVQNYVCGATTEQQESCAVDGGEPLLCQHNSSSFYIHGICKQEDCSAPKKYSKFILLSYYKEWLERTVPGLASFYGSQGDTSSQVEEGEPKSEVSAGGVAPEKTHQKTGHAEDETEKCPLLTHPPPVHVHNLVVTKDEHSDRTAFASSDDTSSSSVTLNLPHSDNGVTSDVTVPDVLNSGGTARQPISSADLPPVDGQDFSRAAPSVPVSEATHDLSLLEVTAGGDGSNSDVALSTAAGLTSSDSPHTVTSVSPTVGSHDVAGDISREENLLSFIVEKESDSRNSNPVNATHNDTSPADGEVSPNVTPVQISSGDPASVAPLNSADSVLNVTVLLASLADGWYLSNATRSAPHLSGSDEKLDLDQLEKLISDNGALLNFSYVVHSANLSLPGNRNRSVETAPKPHLSAGSELAKSGADSPNSLPSNQVKSASLKSPDSVGKSGQIEFDSFKPQNVLPSDGETPSQEMRLDKPQIVLTNLTNTGAPGDTASISVAPPQNLTTESPHVVVDSQPAASYTLQLSPKQWDWLKQNAMRMPKNPLKNPKILGKTLLFKQPHRKYDKAHFAEEHWRDGQKEQLSDSGSSGFPSSYREKWSSQVFSYSHQHPSFYSSEEHVENPQLDRSHPPGNDMLKSGVSSKVARDVLHKGPDSSRSRRSVTSKKPHSGGADRHPADTRIRRNTFTRAGPSRDVPHVDPTLNSPAPTAEMKGRRHSSSSANRRQPEGTFFGAVSSSVKARLKRSGIYDGQHDEPADWNTLLADLASWPARVGVAPSELTPRVSFLTAVNETYSPVAIPPSRSFYLYFKILRAFLPGGNVARRLDMYKKKLTWGPPITYNEFTPLKPFNKEPEGQHGSSDENDETEEEEDIDEEENFLARTEESESTQFNPDEPAGSTDATEHSHRKAREVKNDFPTTSGAGVQHRGDGGSISAELDLKNENHTAGDHNSSYSGSPNGANISDQPESGIPVGTIDIGKEATLSTVDTQKETTLLSVNTQKETVLPSVNTRKETTVDKQKSTLLYTTDVQKEATLSTVGTQRQTTVPTANAEKVSTPATVSTGKVNRWPTVRRRIEIEETSEEIYSTPPVDVDREGDAVQVATDSEDQNRQQADFYEKINRLGADDGTNAAQKVASILGVAHTLVLTWISMP